MIPCYDIPDVDARDLLALAEELEADAATWGREADREATNIYGVVRAAVFAAKSETLYQAAALARVRAGLLPRVELVNLMQPAQAGRGE